MYALTLKKSNSVLIRTDTFGMTAVIGLFSFFLNMVVCTFYSPNPYLVPLSFLVPTGIQKFIVGC